MSFERGGAFEDRPTAFAGLREHKDWRIKFYDIHHQGDTIEEDAFAVATERLFVSLPNPAVAKHRPGAAFYIRHQGRSHQYAVLCWWDSVNELVNRILVRERHEEVDAWHPAAKTQSFCAHDLAVMWFERNAYIEHVLSASDGPDVDAYLASCYQQSASYASS